LLSVWDISVLEYSLHLTNFSMYYSGMKRNKS
jgi:hypothetical protein